MNDKFINSHYESEDDVFLHFDIEALKVKISDAEKQIKDLESGVESLLTPLIILLMLTIYLSIVAFYKGDPITGIGVVITALMSSEVHSTRKENVEKISKNKDRVNAYKRELNILIGLAFNIY